ncbi:MAG: hypothetical protein ACYS47_16220, partial [Planctomycetota bacterium]
MSTSVRDAGERRAAVLPLAGTALLLFLLLPAFPVLGQDGKKKPPSPPSLKSKAKGEIKKLIAQYFKAGDDGARAEVLKRIAAFDP